jgi:transcriptional regulator with XRE-family HTH domain
MIQVIYAKGGDSIMIDEDFNSKDETDPEREKLLRYYDAGKYLKELRGERSLTEVGKMVGMSGNYVSSVEKGRLVPSDNYILLISEYYGIDVDDLFIRWGKVPILAREVVKNNETLQKVLSEIARDKRLDDDEKDEMYDEVYKTYQRHIKKKEALEAAKRGE